MLMRPGIDLRQVEQVVHHFGQLDRRFLNEPHLPFLLVGERAVQPIQAECAPSLRIAPSGVRNSWLM